MAFGFITHPETTPPVEEEGNSSSAADVITILSLIQSITVGINSGMG